MRKSSLVSTLAFAFLAQACLPDDTRPPPTEVHVSLTPDDAFVHGIPSTATADGWDIAFSRSLLVLGRAGFDDGPDCNAYSDARYTRLFNLMTPGTKKVSWLFGLGQCAFGFRIANPEAETLLSEGATDADKIFMGTAHPDRFAPDATGVSFYIEGTATQGTAKKTFAWTFVQNLSYDTCEVEENGKTVSGLTLKGDDLVDVDILVRPAALFEDRLDSGMAQLRFEAFANADTKSGNDDGVVTLEELDKVQLTDLIAEGVYVDPTPAAHPWKTLADYLYLGAFPKIARYKGTGSCDTSVRTRGKRPG